MTFPEYVSKVGEYMRANPEQRMGQAFLNVLWEEAPGVYADVCTVADPFHDENKLPLFLLYVKTVFE